MSYLVTMRRRIKAVQTIKKITSAMRLISRAFHIKMHKKHVALINYQKELMHTFSFLHAQHPTWNPIHFSPKNTEQNAYQIFIIIGSQKGLCGTYNNDLVYWIDTHQKTLQAPHTHVIVISKRLEEQCLKRNISLLKTTPELTLSSLDNATDMLFETLFKSSVCYTKALIISNKTQGFFKQELNKQQILPFLQTTMSNANTFAKRHTNYYWSHDADAVMNACASLFIKNTLYTALFESLMGEQAARFISMDNATRNANNFLETMQLQYNKARQAKITKELTELASAFESSFL